MALIELDDSALLSDRAARNIEGRDRRWIAGFRAALELLGVPLPAYALRKQAGRSPLSAEILRGFHADNPDAALIDNAPKPYSGPKRSDDEILNSL
ncbi:hypothetical protein [Sphingobium phenoxybenzoativorans]|jgi:hypothetical protein|uniref:hypothetical protein n=1 Tax=Sphingobium phenoxybenzoativorans TaxID=1592790 RepID=UPI000871B4C5|nr:hypothetical protein [Sphingobium phenoxybenzoativorans]